MRNTGLEEAKAGIKTAGRIINNLRYADDTTLMAESEDELKSLLMTKAQQALPSMVKNWKHFPWNQEQDKGAHSHHYYST